ncbi:MAG: 2OG-Fe(II) oxygenase [Myxococcaceae bacterium]
MASGPHFFLLKPALRTLALAQRESYRKAKPYPHVVLDAFLGASTARELAAAFPSADHPDWKRRDYEEQSARLGQLQRNAFEGVDGRLRHLLNELCGMAFIDFLETLTGIYGLIADPHFRGAGLHCTLRGGHLALHADFNRDRFRSLSRRVTVLYYLNDGWLPDWGGALELWNAELTRCEAKISPVLDRMVVMNHGDTFWHGHPTPVECPEGRGRAAVAAYFYSAHAPEDAAEPHSAIWVGPKT